MKTEYFPHFCRANFPAIKNEENETLIIELGVEFEKYLLEVFKGDIGKLAAIWDITPATIIDKQMRGGSTNGYHPALVLHFHNFIEKLNLENEKQQKPV